MVYLWFCRVSLCHLSMKVSKNVLFLFHVSEYNKSFFVVVDKFLIVLSLHITHILNR